AVASGVAALEQLDAIDFREVLVDAGSAKELLEKVARIVPMVFWHYLFEAFLKEWEKIRVAVAAASDTKMLTPSIHHWRFPCACAMPRDSSRSVWSVCAGSWMKS